MTPIRETYCLPQRTSFRPPVTRVIADHAGLELFFIPQIFGKAVVVLVSQLLEAFVNEHKMNARTERAKRGLRRFKQKPTSE
jgi:hypothetical protein